MGVTEDRINQITSRLKAINRQRSEIMENVKQPHAFNEQNALEARKRSLEAEEAALRVLAQSLRSKSESIEARQNALSSRFDALRNEAKSGLATKDTILRKAEAYDRDRESFNRDVERYEQERQSMLRRADSYTCESNGLERDGDSYNRSVEAERDATIAQVNSLFDEEADLRRELKSLGEWKSRTWSEPVGGSDASGAPITVSFGEGSRNNETMIADGDQTDSRDDDVQSFTSFREHDNHNHYGSGDGPHGNAKDRGKYSGPGF